MAFRHLEGKVVAAHGRSGDLCQGNLFPGRRIPDPFPVKLQIFLRKFQELGCLLPNPLFQLRTCFTTACPVTKVVLEA